MSKLTTKYQYEDIPEITFTQRQELLIKKEKEPLSDLEEFMLNKNYFQSLLSNCEDSLGFGPVSMDIEILSWNEYCKVYGI
jgi:hypothetical protein